MPGAATKLMTVEEFFVWQQGKEDRYELVEGVPVKLMTDASEVHDVILTNILASLHAQLRGAPCRAATADLAVKTKIRSLRRADVLVTCDNDPPRADSYSARNPRLVVEVLSPTKKGAPWQRKLEEYRRLTGTTYILLVDSEVGQVVFLARTGEQWEHHDFDGREGVIPLTEINCSLAMSDIYEGVTISEGA